jgi:hypothetical protein
MKKLRLDINDVCVESFETVEAEAPGGTVLGREDLVTRTLQCGTCPQVSCAPCP